MNGRQCLNYCIFIVIFCLKETAKADSNIALNKPARASNEDLRHPSLANDGSDKTRWGAQSCVNIGGGGTTRWWQVDLENEFYVEKVKVTNRGDCCPGRIKDFSIDVYETDPMLNPFTPAKHCSFHPGPMLKGGITVTLTCDTPVLGRFLRITQMTGQLQFCELQAFGKLAVRYEPCGWFNQNKGKRSNSLAVTYLGPETSNRADCASECARDVTCTGFNIQFQPVLTCQLVHDPNGGAVVTDTAWDFYILNSCWKRCD